ncbi:hypothetical protein AOLI_G00313810 [Acnodon oligacanthus]
MILCLGQEATGSFLLLLLRQQSCAVEQRTPPSYVTVPKEAAGRFEDIAKGQGANRALGMVHRNYNGQVGKHTSEAGKQYCSQCRFERNPLFACRRGDRDTLLFGLRFAPPPARGFIRSQQH